MSRKLVQAAVCVALVLVTAGTRAQGPATAPADPLYLAIRNDDRAQIEALLKNDADVNATDRRGGATPLMHAAALGSLGTMRLLIDRGADVNARSATGATALMWAVADPAKVRLLIERGADVNAVSESGRSALLLAAMSDGSADSVQLLMDRGANPHVVDGEKTTTMVAATFGNDTRTVRRLVEAGVDVNAASVVGNTPLMNAAANGNVEVVKLLLSKGASVNAVSAPPGQKVKNGTIALGQFTPLVLAAAYGPLDVVRALIDAGADVNAKEARGMTPLMYAAATDHGDLEIARLLIARGADLKARTPAGETVMDWARKSGSTPLVAMLREAGGTAAPMPSHKIPEPAPAALRPSVDRGVALLERTAGTFFVNGACGSCHAQNITDIATMTARRSGFTINAEAAAQRAGGAAAQFAAIAPRLYERFDGPAVDILLYTLAGFAAANHPADRATDALVFNVAAQQWRDGRWHLGGLTRPPIEDGDFSRTALGVRALAAYGPPGRRSEMRDRVRRAVAWLQAATPRSTEDLSFRLLGLHWGGENAERVRRAADRLVAKQRDDGGWGQRDEMASDAYATGLASFALLESGAMTGSSAAVQRASKYLLASQRADGSWFVKSRSPKFQPYFEGGFPYAHDQWISAMATGWATAALAATAKEDGAVTASAR